ncbi:uncharacterized protein LOC124957877 [Vespa velutina]|uniref:uncharacterized protein LOC124957877 n=1 Tax=Vespa velutina TaxID=202808 RepID=UPI001FB22942|nr:uncharacterized protein LOC124957877 [Vespa velutina]
MTLQYFLIFFIFFIVCHGLSEEREYSSTDELLKKQFTEDRFFPNIVRDRNSSKGFQTKNNENNSDDKNTDKKARTVIRGSPSLESRGSNCCGNRHGSGSSSRPDYNRIPSENNHYSSSYGDRNVDRHSWQIPIRPMSSNIGSERPNVGSYSGSYGGNGAYSGTYAGDRYGQRPSYGSESSNRPGSNYNSADAGGYGYGNGGYGSYGGTRPGHGITATLENGNDFNPDEPDIPDNNVPQYPGSNIQTQKAVALKALAGVALIGAAAALATNPVLLPIGIVSGRRKRSEITSADNDIMNYVLQMIATNFSQTYDNGRFENKKYVSPKCVARLTCEIRKDYMIDITEDIKNQHDGKITKIQFNKLIQNNVLNAETIDNSVKELIKMALTVSSNRGNCGVFACNFRRNNLSK